MSGARNVVAVLEKQLEEVWHLTDTLFEDLSPDDWQRTHGADWTFADLPWHLYYIDRDLVVNGVRQGREMSEADRLSFASTDQLNQWNDAQIAARPTDQPVEKSLEMMRTIREECRQMVAQMDDAAMEDEAWFPLVAFRGWRNKAFVANFCLNHTYGHFMEARYRLKRHSPEPSSELVYGQLSGLMQLMPLFVNKAAAVDQKLRARFEFTGAGGGSWTMDVDHGQVCVTENDTSKVDLVMTQSLENFMAMSVNAINPMWALLTGKLKVKGFRHMGAFGKLTSPPPLDQEVDPV